MKNLLLLSLFASLLFTNISAQTVQTETKAETKTRLATAMPKIFVAPTYDGFHNFISAALLENKLKIKVTTDDGAADYIIVCSSAKGQNKWYDTWFGTEKDRNQGSMKVIRVSDKTVVWASASGDKSFWFSGLKDMGQEKVANRLARKLRSDWPQLASGAPDASLDTQAKKTNVADILGSEASVPKASATASSPQTAEEYSQKGIKEFSEQHYVNAELAFREAVKLAPLVAAYHFNLATALNIRGKLDEAEQEAELATRLDPNQETYKKGLEVIRNNRSPKAAQSVSNGASNSSGDTASGDGNKTVHVNGYTKADGTHVDSYNRSAPH